MTTVTITQLFNGDVAGRGQETYRIESAGELVTLLRQYDGAGEGWGRAVAMRDEDARALGAYETEAGELMLDTAIGYVPVERWED